MRNTLMRACLVAALFLWSSMASAEDCWVNDCWADAGGEDTYEQECLPGEGCFLDKCSDNSKCMSGWCVQHMGENVCTVPCVEECPTGLKCKQVSGGPDIVFICISTVANLCKPCLTNADCVTVGAEDVCVDYGEQGNFCGGGCGQDDDCPWGFSCQDVVTVDGAQLQQCVSEQGVCPCTEASYALGLWTSCYIANEHGQCQGKRVCTAAGLTDCDAQEPAPESCDGVDNNCDGTVDEGCTEEPSPDVKEGPDIVQEVQGEPEDVAAGAQDVADVGVATAPEPAIADPTPSDCGKCPDKGCSADIPGTAGFGPSRLFALLLLLLALVGSRTRRRISPRR